MLLHHTRVTSQYCKPTFTLCENFLQDSRKHHFPSIHCILLATNKSSNVSDILPSTEAVSDNLHLAWLQKLEATNQLMCSTLWIKVVGNKRWFTCCILLRVLLKNHIYFTFLTFLKTFFLAYYKYSVLNIVQKWHCINKRIWKFYECLWFEIKFINYMIAHAFMIKFPCHWILS